MSHCPYCRKMDCYNGSKTECWESMVAASLPVAQVLELLRANKLQQDAAKRRRS